MSLKRKQKEVTIPQLEQSEKSLKELAFLSQVADMYYNQNLLQSEIASKLFFSRSKVSRLLTQARELGIVDIKIRQVLDRIPSVEEALKKTFHLKDAVVINSFSGENKDEQNLEMITDFASIYVSNLLKDNITLGVSNGRAVNIVTRKINKLHDCDLNVVQILGSGSNAHQAIESRDLVMRFSEIFTRGHCYFLNAPIYIDNAFARSQILQDKAIKTVFEMMSKCDIILSGIGGFDVQRFHTTEIIREYQTDAHARELEAKGAVGCVCALYYDINGNYIDCEWNNKCVSIPFENIKKNPMTIGVACRDDKVLPMLGALRGGLINVVITDVDTATKVLERNSELQN